MPDRDPFVVAQLVELHELFEEIDDIAELADILKDDRKYQAIANCVAMIDDYKDPTADNEIAILAAYDGLTWQRTIEAIECGHQRAQESRAWRAGLPS